MDRMTPDGLLACCSCPREWRMPARYMATPKRIDDAPSATDWPVCEEHMQYAMCAGWFPINEIAQAQQQHEGEG